MTRRKIVPLCVGLLMALSGCSAGDKPMLPAGTLRCAADLNSAEMTELAEYIAADIGAELTLVQSDSQGALSMLGNDLVDIALFPYPESDGMDSKFIGCIPFAEKLVYCVHRDSVAMTAVSDCRGLVAGVSSALTDEEKKIIAASAGDDGRIYCDSAARAAEMLDAGTLDVYYCGSDEALELLENNSTLRCSQPADLPAENLSTAVLRSNEKLYSAVNSAIEHYLNDDRR